MMMFQARIPSPLTKVCSHSGAAFDRMFCPSMSISVELLMCNIFECLADMIYEDVQRDTGPANANNGWSSSEFESYDEQSDNETKLPTRSKVLCVCVCGGIPEICIYLTKK